MTGGLHVFQRSAVRRHRDRAARHPDGHDFLHREVAVRLAERLGEVRRNFPLALDLGCNRGALTRALTGGFGIETIVQSDLSPLLARAARDANPDHPAVAADEEALPFAPGRFDLVVSSFTLHRVNDLPGALIQAHRALKPDGLFLAAFAGGGTLAELRQSLMEAEVEEEGGAGPRVSPFADLRDAGGLLQRAGFAMPMIDRDTLTLTYDTALALMRDLRLMGETNAVAERRKAFSRRATLMRAAEIYRDRFAEADGRIPATFEIIYLTAWSPDASQPKPLQPGSAKTGLAEALGTEEVSAGEAAVPRKRR